MLIGEMLVEEGIITKEQLKDALEDQKRTGEKIGQVLIRMGYISKEILWTFLGYQMGVPYINLDEIPDIKQDMLRLLPEQLMRSEKLIPVNKQGKVLTVAMTDPLNFLVVDDLKATTRCEVDARLSPEEDIVKMINKYLGFKEADTGEIAKSRVDALDDILAAPIKSRQEEPGLTITRSPYGGDVKKREEPPPPPPAYSEPAPRAEPAYAPPPPPPPPVREPEPQHTAQAVMAQDTPVNTFLTTLLAEAYDSNATDIHVEPLSDKCRIRKRLDGTLYELESPPKTLYNGMLNKIKELAQMNTAEKNTPQESKLKIRVSGREINMSVYTFPTLFGEKIVLRIVRAENTIILLANTGMEESVLEAYKKVLKQPHGLILIAGPTNSGKATTMYSSLNEINTPAVNIFSVEDTSVNYLLPGINQTKVSRKSFGQAIRMLGEQDCDVLAVSDMAGKETAEAAFDTIAGGHLVISNIRAGDPFQALQTIINFGIEPYVVYSNTSAVLAQRLVRKICGKCRQQYEAPDDIVKMLGGAANKVTLYKGAGCDACSRTGYSGRTAVYELIPMSEKIREMLLAGDSLKKIRDENKKSAGLSTLKESALMKAIQGTTTIEEYMKI